MSESEDFKQASLDYHRVSPPGKIKVVATKPMLTQRDLALAYSPASPTPARRSWPTRARPAR
jgi:malate dehydrogenase (oxaloacetate-decarboxylating)(NADP+)